MVPEPHAMGPGSPRPHLYPRGLCVFQALPSVAGLGDRREHTTRANGGMAGAAPQGSTRAWS